jgi:hypothetical protein
MIVAIGLHPQATTHRAAEFMVEAARLGTSLKIVHGTAIAFVLTLLFGMSVYSARRGMQRELVVAALVAYAAGIAVVILAALIDGFLIAMIAERYIGVPPNVLQVGAAVVAACGAAIQVLTKAGVAMISAGIALWAADLFLEPRPARTTAIVGCVAALVPVAVLFAVPRLAPHTLEIVVVCEGAWYLAIARLLIRGEA